MKIFKTKYKFNKDSLQYEKEKFSFKKFLIRLIPYTISSIISGVIIMFLYIVVFESPEEKYLRSENEFLKSNIDAMNIRLQLSDSLLNEIAQRDNYIYRSMFNQDTIPATIRDAGIGGSEKYKKYDGYEATDIVKNVAKKLDRIETKLNIQSQSYEILIAEVKKQQKFNSSYPIIAPMHPNEYTRIGSFYGYRPHPILRIVRMHTGIDLNAPKGTPIYATGDGVVTTTVKSRKGYGNMVEIDHGIDGLSTRYAHLNTIEVRKGQHVKRGEIIGTCGSTGLSTGSHLHYEILINGKHTNPMRYFINISASEYEEIRKQASYEGTSYD